MNDWSDEETDDPLVADPRNFYKVEKWARDGLRVVVLLYAGSSVDRAHAIFATMHGQALAEHPADHPTTDARAAGVAAAVTRAATNVALTPGKILLGGCRNQPCPFD